MAYQVLARKWRPQSFAQVCSQEHITQTLLNAVKHKKIGHAYLFTGSRGVGKTSIARIYATMIRCLDTEPPCGQCPCCRDAKSTTNMDVLEIDGASHTGVDSIRELRETVSYQPTTGKYKIYIIDEVHMLSTNAFNALLKTLEEPPAHVVFIMATTEPHKIPHTILSRCQRFDFKRIGPSSMVSYLEKVCGEESIKIDKKALLSLCHAADGSLRDALSILDQLVMHSGDIITEEVVNHTLGLIPHSLVQKTLQAIIQKDMQQSLKLVHDAFDQGYDFKVFCTQLLEYARLILILKSSGSKNSLLETMTYRTSEEIQFLGKIAEQLSREELIQLFQILLKGSQEVAISSFPKFALELVLMKAMSVYPVESIAKLLEHVSHKNQNESKTLWSPAAFIRVIKMEQPYLATLLEGAHWKLSENKVLLVVKANGLGVEKLEHSKTLEYLNKMALEHFGQNIQFQVQVSQESEKFLHPQEDLKQQMLQDEVVQQAKNIFDGTLQTVKSIDKSHKT